MKNQLFRIFYLLGRLAHVLNVYLANKSTQVSVSSLWNDSSERSGDCTAGTNSGPILVLANERRFIFFIAYKRVQVEKCSMS